METDSDLIKYRDMRLTGKLEKHWIKKIDLEWIKRFCIVPAVTKKYWFFIHEIYRL